MKHMLASVLFALLTTWSVSAQEVTGKVVSTTGEPLEFATVKISTLPDSIVIAGGISRKDGTFAFRIDGKSYPLLLEASMLGFSTAQAQINTPKNHILTLTEEAIMLNEAVITGQKIPHKLVPGGLSTDIINTPLGKLTDIYSILRGVPMIEIEGEKVTVTGKGSPVIYLNDRRMTDPNQLKLLKPYLIDRIEVVTNPGAEYNSSVQSVLKIYTRREPGSGLSGMLFARAEHQLESPGVSGNPYIDLNYRMDNWDFFTQLYTSRNTGITNTPTMILDGRTEDGNWLNKSALKYSWDGISFGVIVGVNYTDKDQSAGAKYSINGNNNTSYGQSDMRSQLDNNTPTRYLVKQIEKDKWNYTHRPSLYYLRKLGEWTAQIDADYYLNKNALSDIQIKEGHTEAYELRTLNSSNGSSKSSIGSRLKANGPLWGGQLTIGGEYSMTNNQYFTYNDQALKLPNLDSEYKESLTALFIDYEHNIGKNWNLSAGLRLEHLKSQYMNKGGKGDKQYRQYTNFFPTLSIGGRLWGFNTQLSFRSNINRPSYWQLQPRYAYVSRFQYSAGNPTLHNSISYNTQLMINKKWFTLILNDKYTVDDISQRTVRMPDLNNPGKYLPYTSLLDSFNAKPYHTINAIIVISPTIGWWRPTLTAMAAKMIGYDVWHFDQHIKDRKPIFRVMLKNNFTLPKDIILSLDLNCMTSGASQNYDFIEPTLRTYAQISKKWLKNKQLTTSFSVNNLFNSKQNLLMAKDRYTTLTNQQHVPTTFTFTVTYRFNTTNAKYKGSGALDSVVGRMEN